MPAENLSLYRIDETLAQLFEVREELVADGAPAEELAVIDQQLREYKAMIPAKVEGVAAMDREWEGKITAILGPKDKNGVRKGGEVGRLKDIAATIEARREWLRSYLAEILEKQPLPAKGKSRKLVGAAGSVLMLKTNGGAEPLEIADPRLVPIEYCDCIIRMPYQAFVALLLEHAQPDWDISAPEPSNKRIREALAQPCAVCSADRQVLRENPALGDDAKVQCSACGGSGRQGVPGAHLLPRGQHVEIK